MSKRVTVILSDINHKKICVIRSKLIADGETASFSRVVNEMITKALKKD